MNSLWVNHIGPELQQERQSKKKATGGNSIKDFREIRARYTGVKPTMDNIHVYQGMWSISVPLPCRRC
jgi:hypothetical protein